MCVNGCCNTKGCSNIKSIPGPQGIQGIQGEQGEAGRDGIDGLPGAAGGLQFEYYFNSPLDLVWQNIETVQPELNHTIVGPNGNYQIHLNLTTNQSGPTMDGELRLYVGGALVQSLQLDDNNLDASYQSNVLFWRGSANNGDDVEVRHFALGGFCASINGNILINRES